MSDAEPRARTAVEEPEIYEQKDIQGDGSRGDAGVVRIGRAYHGRAVRGI